MQILRVVGFAGCLAGGYALFFAFTHSTQQTEAGIKVEPAKPDPTAPAAETKVPLAPVISKDFDYFKGLGGDDKPVIEISAERFAREYRSDPFLADSRFMGRALLVEGIVSDITMRQSKVALLLDAIPAAGDPQGGMRIFCLIAPKSEKELWTLARGQRVKVDGTGEAPLGTLLSVVNCKVHSRESSPAMNVTAKAFADEFGSNASAAEKKYAGRQLVLAKATVSSRDGNSLVLAGKIQASWAPELNKLFEKLEPGDIININGEYLRFSNGTLELGRCWLVPPAP